MRNEGQQWLLKGVIFLGLWVVCSIDSSPAAAQLKEKLVPEVLPRGLCLRIENQIKTLMLPPEVDSLQWLPPNSKLERVILRSSIVTKLDGLPARLQLLDVRDCRNLVNLPEKLAVEVLDLTGSGITRLPESTLRHLGLGPDQGEILARLPKKLEGLHLVGFSGSEVFTKLKVGTLPPTLQVLSLEGPVFRQLDGYPSQLRELWLIDTLIADLRLLRNSNLHRLRLSGNPRLVIGDLPTYLASLEFYGGGSLGLDGKKLQGLTHLALRGGSMSNLDKLPHSLRSLELGPGLVNQIWKATSTPPDLLQGLESLAVTGPMGLLCREGLPPIDCINVIGSEENPICLHLENFSCGTPAQGWAAFPRVLSLNFHDSPHLAMISGLNELFPNLRVLVLSNTALQRLPDLPSAIKILDIRGSQIRALPSQVKKLSSLKVLVIAPGQLDSLENLPDSVEALYILESGVSIETPFFRSVVGSSYGVM